jgi:hypothetical protein
VAYIDGEGFGIPSQEERVMRGTRMLCIGLAVVLLGAASTGALAQPTFTNADLQGRYAFACGEWGWSSTNDYNLCQGVFTADGNGNIVSGIRNFIQYQGGSMYQFLEQAFTGTYAIGPDGRGTGEWLVADPIPGFSANETLHLVLGGDGGVYIRGYVPPSAGPVAHPILFMLDVARQGEPGGGTSSVILDRLDELEARLEALECEEIRLLLTPEGLRESDCCGAPLDFPNGKSRPSCGSSLTLAPLEAGTEVRTPAPPQR